MGGKGGGVIRRNRRAFEELGFDLARRHRLCHSLHPCHRDQRQRTLATNKPKTPTWVQSATPSSTWAVQTTFPLEMVTTGVPVTSQPSQMLVSIACLWVEAEMVRLTVGSKTTMSASDPTAITPFCGYMLKMRAVLVENTAANSLGVSLPVGVVGGVAGGPSTKARP